MQIKKKIKFWISLQKIKLTWDQLMFHVTCFKQEINKRGIIKTAKYFVKNIRYNKLCLMYK